MANEVDITITARDLTGPAFASALLKMEAMKKAAKEVGKEFSDIGGFTFDTSKATASLNQLKNRIQSLGIADIADVNVAPGRITTQLMLLKRLISQQKISDLLDVNVNTTDLQNQLNKISNLSETIPVNFDVANLRLPHDLPTETVPVTFDVKMPNISIEGLKNVGIDAATLASWAELNSDVYKLHAGLGDLRPMIDAIRSGFTSGASRAWAFSSGMLAAWRSTDMFRGAALRLSDAIDARMVPAMARGAGGARTFFGGGLFLGPIFRAAAADVTLFGGALSALGVKGFPATIKGFHIMADSIFEVLAVLIPGVSAFVAFGVASVGTVMDINRSMEALWHTTHALNQNIYPLTGNMGKLEDAVKPQVWSIFGDMLLIVDRNADHFNKLAADSANVVDHLATRITAALTSGGFQKLLNEGPKDLAVLGDIIGNIFGSIAGVLRVVPGYAQILFAALDMLTKGLDAIVNNPIGQAVLQWGMIFHGAIVWIGLAVTMTVRLGDALVGLAAKFGLASAGALAFDAASFGLGIKQMIQGAVLLTGELLSLGAAEDIAAAGALTMEGAWAAVSAINPLVWIGIALAGLGALVYWLTRSKDSTNEYANAAQKAIQTLPVSQVGVTLTRQYAAAVADMNRLQASASISALIELQAIDQLTKGQHALTQQQKVNVAAAQTTLQQYADQAALLPVIRQDQKAYNDLLKVSGGNLSLVTDAGVSWSQWLSGSKSDRQQYTIEIQAQAAAQRALALGTGRAAAAQNAQTNIFMQETVPAMQKVTKAEDDLINTVLGGRQAFNAFQQAIMGTTAHFVSPSGLADAFKLAKGNLSGLNEQSLAYSNTLFNIAIPDLQKMIDALDMQSISTADLSKVVATGSQQILQYSGSNTEARATMVALINNALGPGTVSLQTLDKWVKQNSTSLTGMNSIIAKSTIQAGTLANVLQTQLNVQFQEALLKSSGATRDIQGLTDAITHGGTQTQAFRNARQQLINDLINTGMNARDATSFVNGLQKKIDDMHGKSVSVGVNASGSGGITATATGLPSRIFKLEHLAEGGRIMRGTSPTADDVLVLASRDETIVSAEDSRKLAPIFRRMGIRGYAGGGSLGTMPSWSAAAGGYDIQAMAGAEAASMLFTMIQSWKATAPKGGPGTPIVGPGGGSPAQNVALAQKVLGWSGGEFADLVRLWTQESGWNQFAYNASSGATGIPQALPYTKMPQAAWLPFQGGQANVMAQETWGADYIRGRYGSPSAAWAHEVAFNWYDGGGWLKPGLNFMMNGTGRPEHLSRDYGSRGITLEVVSGGQSEFDKFMVTWVKRYVRVHGGGDVQTAFGKN